MKIVSLVIPMYFEELVAKECYDRTSKILKDLKDFYYEIILVNDESKDRPQYVIDIKNI